jgi:hypothetical protein
MIYLSGIDRNRYNVQSRLDETGRKAERGRMRQAG